MAAAAGEADHPSYMRFRTPRRHGSVPGLTLKGLFPVADGSQGTSVSTRTTPGGWSSIAARLSLALTMALLPVCTVPAESARAVGPLAPASGTLFGTYVQPETGWNRDDVVAAVNKLESDIGRRLDIDQHYYPWHVPFPSWKEEWDLANGRIPLITWGSIRTSRINSGSQDALIRARADGVKALGEPVFLRFFAEMDGDFLSSRTGSPSSYIAAWRRAQWIFASRGATNAVWVWCPTAWGFAEGGAQKFYPGDAYVDWLCADGFNWAPDRPGARWRSFAKIYEAFYEYGVEVGKPLMVGEFGCLERGQGEKAQWITEARDALKNQLPGIAAVVFFDSKGDYDFRVDTSPSSYEAYKSMAADPHFKPPHEGLLPVDPSRFDATMADSTPPVVRILAPTPGASRFRARLRIRWRTIEPHKDVASLRYRMRGHAWKVINAATADDGGFVWGVPRALQGRTLQVALAVHDLAGNQGVARSPWMRLR
jgi:hypothetical protein